MISWAGETRSVSRGTQCGVEGGPAQGLMDAVEGNAGDLGEERPDGGYLHVKRLVVDEWRKRWEFDQRGAV